MAPKMQNFADGPYKLIAPPSGPRQDPDHFAHHMAEQMSYIHNVLLRGLNAIYLQAAAVQPGTQDARDFLFFAHAWTGLVHHHHDLEEEMFFPLLQAVEGVPAGAMDANIAQHAAFEPGLLALQTYTQSTSADAYDAAALCALIDAFGPGFRAHLADEIPALAALEAAGPAASARFRAIWAACDKKAQQDDPFTFGPLSFGLSDATVAPAFPPAPPLVPYLVKYVFALRHRRAWRFLPADFFRQPRSTAFLPPPADLARLKGEVVVETCEVEAREL